MELWLMPRAVNRLMRDSLRDLDRIERGMFPYWRGADHSILHVGNEAEQTINDDKEFAVSLDVSQFRPEELNVHLEGRELTIEGNQEHKDENTFMKRSFVRKWVLPEDVDLDALRTQLTDKGKLCIEAPKVGGSRSKRKKIPIMTATSSNQK